MLAPLTQLAFGEARNATTWATSSGVPKRPNGSSRRTNSAMPSGSACCRFHHDPPGKRIDPGAMLLTRMLSRASCCASDLARLISAALTALYVIRPPVSRPKIDAIIRMTPPPRRFMWGTASFDARTAGMSVWSIASCQSASVVAIRSPPRARPTLFTRMSRPPNRATVWSTSAATPSAVATSACTAKTRAGSPQADPTSASASASRPGVRAQSATRQPSRASAVALASPRPRLEPVMMAILSVSSRFISTLGAWDSGFARLRQTACWPASARLRDSGLGTRGSSVQLPREQRRQASPASPR